MNAWNELDYCHLLFIRCSSFDSMCCARVMYIWRMFPNSLWISCRILGISTKELHALFDVELPDNLRQPPSYARNFLEFCSYKALHLAITRPNYLTDKEFCRLTFDMMVAWEDPGADSNFIDKVRWNWSFSFRKISYLSNVIVCILFIFYFYFFTI